MSDCCTPKITNSSSCQIEAILLLKLWSTGQISVSSVFPPGGSKGISSWADWRGCFTVSDPDQAAACCHVAAYSCLCRSRAREVLQYFSKKDQKDSHVSCVVICHWYVAHVCFHTSARMHAHLKGNPVALYKHACSDSWRTNIQDEEMEKVFY